jgi:hypothetical protein
MVNGKHNSTGFAVHKTFLHQICIFLLDSKKRLLSYLKRFNKGVSTRAKRRTNLAAIGVDFVNSGETFWPNRLLRGG